LAANISDCKNNHGRIVIKFPKPQHALVQNHLLAALPQADYQRWAPHLESVELRAGQALYEAGSAAAYVYFPSTAVISLISMTLDGASVELAVVGAEGMAGVAVWMGSSTMFSQAVVQSAGYAYRLRAPTLRGELQPSGAVLALLLQYTQALMAHVAQTALCNRYHTIDQQLSKRLLLALDRSQADELSMTQESVANLLGVRREGVTAAALKLQHAGVIRYQRGHIVVLDRDRLEQCACECYACAKQEHLRLLPSLPVSEVPGSVRLPQPRPALPRRSWHAGLSLAA
jgi:CRP-like cAMP-binding protein